jgi:cell wall-associated NlpC family hydrolase
MTPINDLIGKPFVMGARGPDAYDCWGLVREVMQRMRPGLALPDWASDQMTRQRHRDLMANQCPVFCQRTKALEDGVLLYSERAGHVAIIVNGWVLTARRFTGVVAQRPIDYAQGFSDLEGFTWRA